MTAQVQNKVDCGCVRAHHLSRTYVYTFIQNQSMYACIIYVCTKTVKYKHIVNTLTHIHTYMTAEVQNEADCGSARAYHLGRAG